MTREIATKSEDIVAVVKSCKIGDVVEVSWHGTGSYWNPTKRNWDGEHRKEISYFLGYEPKIGDYVSLCNSVLRSTSFRAFNQEDSRIPISWIEKFEVVRRNQAEKF